ncbi:ACH10-like protein [Mya arenaria]|uniref:ACH10-like protein n=1 Tax=Mya arenaria TaxID=6604 RepID=A0ABY7FKU7_MYAAR|nr:ACH10-like protein [Mya arenaria]
MTFPAEKSDCQSGKARLLGKLKDYNKLLAPEGPEGGAVNVTHGMDLKRIISLDNQVLLLDTYLSLTWIDNQLVWDPDDFDGLELIRIPSEKLWQPDIMLENNADQFNGLHSGDINMVITYDGMVFYTPPVKTASFCKVNYKNLKQGDVITCTLTFLSWTYDGDALNLMNLDDVISTGNLDKDFNTHWKFVTSNVKRDIQYDPCCVEPYVKIKYIIKLRYVP